MTLIASNTRNGPTGAPRVTVRLEAICGNLAFEASGIHMWLSIISISPPLEWTWCATAATTTTTSFTTNCAISFTIIIVIVMIMTTAVMVVKLMAKLVVKLVVVAVAVKVTMTVFIIFIPDLTPKRRVRESVGS
jgi:hypothetical protein